MKQELTQRRQSATDGRTLPQLYDKSLPMSESQFRDLQSLKFAASETDEVRLKKHFNSIDLSLSCLDQVYRRI